MNNSKHVSEIQKEREYQNKYYARILYNEGRIAGLKSDAKFAIDQDMIFIAASKLKQIEEQNEKINRLRTQFLTFNFTY